MRKSATIALVLALMAALVASLASAQSEPPQRVRVLRGANLRSGPGTNFADVGGARVGQQFDVRSCNDACTWYELENGRWIAAFLVEPVRSTTESPTPTNTPRVRVTAAPDFTQAASVASTEARRTTTRRNSNLREGPGTTFRIVGRAAAGQEIEIVGRNAAGDWLILASGEWISASLVNGSVQDLSIFDPNATPTPQPTEIVKTTTHDPNSICDWESYPDFCIPRTPPLDCSNIFAHEFTVRPPDPHKLDLDRDGIGCEWDDIPQEVPTRNHKY